MADKVKKAPSELCSRFFLTTLRRIRRTIRRFTELDLILFLVGKDKDDSISLVGLPRSIHETARSSISVTVSSSPDVQSQLIGTETDQTKQENES